jgi:hypothetical protein
MTERKKLTTQEISDRAYELYLQRGSGPGRDIEDWIQAERELKVDVVIAQVKTKAARFDHYSN